MGLFDFLFSRPKKTFGVVRHSLTSEKEASTRENWQKIEELLKLGKPSQLRQAVIEDIKAQAFARRLAPENLLERNQPANGSIRSRNSWPSGATMGLG